MTTTNNQSGAAATLTNGMTDEKLIGYCEIHCTTERALFSVEQVKRMIELAGQQPGEELSRRTTGFISAHEEMAELCKLARERMAATTSNTAASGKPATTDSSAPGGDEHFTRPSDTGRWTNPADGATARAPQAVAAGIKKWQERLGETFTIYDCIRAAEVEIADLRAALAAQQSAEPVGIVTTWSKGGSGEHNAIEPYDRYRRDERGYSLATSLPEGTLLYTTPAAPAVAADWKKRAAEWLRHKANEQRTTNAQCPEHVKCYPTWEKKVHDLEWLAEELERLAAQPAAAAPVGEKGGAQ